MAGYFQEIYLREATVIYIRALCDAKRCVPAAAWQLLEQARLTSLLQQI